MKHSISIVVLAVALIAITAKQRNEIIKLKKSIDDVEHTFSYPAQLAENYMTLRREVSELDARMFEHLKAHIKAYDEQNKKK
jgi:hypothetical protein